MKNYLHSIALGLLPLIAAAGEPPETPSDMYFSKPTVTLSSREKGALAIAQRYQNGGGTDVAPVPGPGGVVRFLFGASQPSIVCAVLQVCDIELQPGEVVNSIHLGDAVRWSVEPAITGTGPSEVQHLIIKPHDVGLQTTLVVPTNRRTYRLLLRSHRTQYMGAVAFTYPEAAQAKWDALRARETKDRQERTIPQTGEYMGNLNFDYGIDGNALWKPVRVYNDGTKTIIQMPAVMAQTEAPTLLVVRKDGGLFTDDETVMVNYRLQGDRYIVDTVFDKAILIAGVGSNQSRITITKGK